MALPDANNVDNYANSDDACRHHVVRREAGFLFFHFFNQSSNIDVVEKLLKLANRINLYLYGHLIVRKGTLWWTALLRTPTVGCENHGRIIEHIPISTEKTRAAML